VKAKLIFNPASGNPAESAAQLLELLRQLQTVNIQAEVLVVQPEMRLSALARHAVRNGFRMVIVSGGDGTIENVALGLVGSATTLGIIPTGTRNNLARSLGIPTDNPAGAVALLREGCRLKIDVGQIRQGHVRRFFLEAGAVGLASALYPSADDIQHGDLGKIPEFISTLVSAAPSVIRLRLDHHRREIITHAHMVLVANMPFLGANFQVAPDVLFGDHQLDVFVYSELGKVDLIDHAVRNTIDERIQRFQVKRIVIATDPPMPVMADGVLLGDGPATLTVLPNGLAAMASPTGIPGAAPAPASVAEVTV